MNKFLICHLAVVDRYFDYEAREDFILDNAARFSIWCNLTPKGSFTG